MRKVLQTIADALGVSADYLLSDKQVSIRDKELKGRNGYRIRVADYRIIYDIFDDVLLVDVINLEHRKDMYE